MKIPFEFKALGALLVASLMFVVWRDYATPSKIKMPSEMNYHEYADSLDLAEIIDSTELTLEALQNRNGKLIIERVIGEVDNASTGAGHVLDNANYYISYESVPNIANGNIICTYLIYNPDNNYEDDIMLRFDYIIDTKGN